MTNVVIADLWQSTLFAGLAALLTLAFRNNRANTRYCIWLAASVKFLIPISPLTALIHNLTWQTASTEVMPASPIIAEPIAPAATMTVTKTVPIAAVPVEHATMSIIAILLVAWACGTAAIFLWWLVRWLRMRAVLRASPLQRDAPIPIRSSPFLLEPGLFGIFRPVIVLPESVLPGLSPQQLDAILAHEMAHWRRRDNLTAAIHMIVEGLFWFHPLVWWIGRRLVVEREQACDEAVIEACCDRQAYAEAVLTICRGYLHQPLLSVSGVTGGDLERRVATIMSAHVGEKLRTVKKLLLTGAACAAIAAPIAMGMTGAWSAAAGELNNGLAAFNHGDYASALAQLQPLADQGNTTAEFRVGQMYDRGLGVKKNYARAVVWYRKAAMQGNIDAQQGLAIMYSQGHGVPQDRLKAALWYRQMVLQDIENPCYPKQMFETQGDKAALQPAAERGDAQAETYLGSQYEMFPFEHPDHQKALKWISKAAAQGNAKGEAALASLYLEGSAVPPDGAAAVAWMRKAAEQGHVRAQCALAVMYDKGIGVAQDHAEAAKWYRTVANTQTHLVIGQVAPDRSIFDFARTRLGTMYETGDGVPQSESDATAWFRRATNHGYPLAETGLGILYAHADGTRRNYAEAARLLGSAARKGEPSAQIALGSLYADGDGVGHNLTMAYEWFSIAARYSTSPEERDEARRDRDAISGRMTGQDIALADRLTERWLPIDEIADRMHAGGVK